MLTSSTLHQRITHLPTPLASGNIGPVTGHQQSGATFSNEAIPDGLTQEGGDPGPRSVTLGSV